MYPAPKELNYEEWPVDTMIYQETDMYYGVIVAFNVKDDTYAWKRFDNIGVLRERIYVMDRRSLHKWFIRINNQDK
jgi:hypothetical protein